MNSQQKFIISLIRSALSEEKIEYDELPDFDKVSRIAGQHSIINLIYAGLLNNDLLGVYDVPNPFFNRVCSNILLSEQQMFFYSKIKREFEKNGIDFLPLKGLKLKQLYKKPDFRSMGDIDILIKTEQYEKVRKIFLDLGIAEGEESDHEFIWKEKNIRIEMHKRLIPSNNTDYVKYFGTGWQFARKVNENSFEYAMSPDDEYVFLFTHLCKHFRESGIGLKHFVDLYVFEKANTLDFEYIAEKLKSLDLYEFYQNVRKVLNVWFLNEESDEKTDFITDYVFSCGNFGTDQNRVFARALVASSENGSFESGKRTLFFRLVFPTFSHMKQKYPILEKAPILLPFTYLGRWFEAVFIKKGTVSHYKNELDNQTQENIDKYKENLNFIGLRYNLDKK